MENFEFVNPTKIYFGKGKIDALRDAVPLDVKVLMTYGGGSIKKNGVYDQVKSALADRNVVEFGGIEPNPKYETLMKAVELVKNNQIDFLLSVGGGSVLDGTKFIAAAAEYNGDTPWDILSKHSEITSALPIGAVLTLPATGSEMNGNSVISRKETQEKLAFGSVLVNPKFSILDPEVTYTLPLRQLANGVVDSFVHTTEQYITYPVNSPVQDRFAEGLLLTLIEEGPKIITEKTPDYESRANLMWASTMALNGLIGSGVKSDWSIHRIGHELTAFHGIDHAVTLAIVWPGVMQYMMEKRREKLLQYAGRVWNLNGSSGDQKIKEAISKTEEFFRSLGIKTRLSEHGVGEDTIDRIVSRFKSKGLKAVGVQQDVMVDDLKGILLSRI